MVGRGDVAWITSSLPLWHQSLLITTRPIGCSWRAPPATQATGAMPKENTGSPNAFPSTGPPRIAPARRLGSETRGGWLRVRL